ncbi:unnamed protein product, partial [Nesidiocoris tenuis]
MEFDFQSLRGIRCWSILGCQGFCHAFLPFQPSNIPVLASICRKGTCAVAQLPDSASPRPICLCTCCPKLSISNIGTCPHPQHVASCWLL